MSLSEVVGVCCACPKYQRITKGVCNTPYKSRGKINTWVKLALSFLYVNITKIILIEQ